MGSTLDDLMKKRAADRAAAYEACWDNGAGSHHPDFDPQAASGPGVLRAGRATEELYLAIVRDDVDGGCPPAGRRSEARAQRDARLGASKGARLLAPSSMPPPPLQWCMTRLRRART